MKKSNSLRNILLVVAAGVVGMCICLLVVVAVSPRATTAPQTTARSSANTNIPAVANTEGPTEPPAFTHTPAPTDTPKPSNTPKPANTPAPSDTPVPPTAAPEPVKLSGSGDSVVDFDNPFDVAIVHIVGNASGGFFAVTSYGSNGKEIDLLVDTTDPYDGIRPLDFGRNERATRFEVNASGKWDIEILPLTAAQALSVPGTFEGKGDDVILLKGSKPDLAKIKGNTESGFFAVTGYGNTSDLLVDTTDPYEGTVMLSTDMVVLEIQAAGAWSIEVTAK